MRFLLLRGLGREARHWHELPARLGDAGFPTLCLDLPGTGLALGSRSPARVEAIAEDVRRRFPQAGEPGWVLGGISLGGMVAMAWVTAHPADFAGVALINTSAADVAPFWARMRPGVLPAVLGALTSRDPRARERRVLGVTTRRLSAADRTALAERWSDAKITRRTVAAQLVAGARFRAPHALPIPALILASGGDALCATTCAARLATRFSAPLRLHPDAGHDLPTDDPAWTAAALTGWAARLGEDGASAGRT